MDGTAFLLASFVSEGSRRSRMDGKLAGQQQHETWVSGTFGAMRATDTIDVQVKYHTNIGNVAGNKAHQLNSELSVFANKLALDRLHETIQLARFKIYHEIVRRNVDAG